MNQNCFNYCVVATIAALTITKAPESKWDWWLYGLRGIAAWYVTWKAYLSTPPANPPNP